MSAWTSSKRAADGSAGEGGGVLEGCWEEAKSETLRRAGRAQERRRVETRMAQIIASINLVRWNVAAKIAG